MEILRRETSNTIERTELWTVRPDRYDQTYLVSVTRSSQPGERVHGLMLTDGNTMVGTATHLVYFLELGQLIPPTATVTIGYPHDNPIPALVARNRDLTPTQWPEFDAAYGRVLGMDCPPSGDCDRFRDFLVDELKPAIEAECGVDPAQWTLGGHSLGGLFATHTLLSTPDAFARYFAVGSSFWWRRPSLFDLAKAGLANAPHRAIAAYLSVGDRESAAALKEEWQEQLKSAEWQDYLQVIGAPDLVRDNQEMANILARYPSYRVKADVHPNETHGTAVFVALSQGLRWLTELPK